MRDESGRVGQRDARGRLAWLCLVVAAPAIVFCNVVSHHFLGWDDPAHVVANPYLQNATAENLARFWRSPYENLYIPATYTFWFAEASLSRLLEPAGAGLDPRLFHLGSLLLHVSASALVFRVLMRLGLAAPGAAAGALLFALHPVQVESVAWISETKGLLCGVCSLLAIWQYVIFAASRGAEGTPEVLRVARRRHYALALLCFLLALLSKPSAIAVPLVVALLDRCWLQRRWRAVALALSPWFLLAGAFALVTKGEQADTAITIVAPLWSRPLIALDALAFYLGKLIVPLNLSYDYGRDPSYVLAQGWWLPAAALVPLGLAMLLGVLPGRREWLCGYGVFLAAVAPVLGLVPFMFQGYSTVADRYLYLPMLGPALVLAWLLERALAPDGLRRGRRLAGIVTLAWLAALGMLSHRQAAVWRDDYALNAQTLAVNPRSWVAHSNWGYALLQDGQPKEAAAHLAQSLELHPENWQGETNLGAALARLGQHEAALPHFDRACQGGRESAWEARYLAGCSLLSLGRPQEAIGQLRAATHLKPELPQTHYNLGSALARCGQMREAGDQFRAAVELDPRYQAARLNYANALRSLGRSMAAEQQYRLLLDGQPADARTAGLAALNLAELLLDRGEPAEAHAWARRALAAQPGSADAHYVAGLALAAQGQRGAAAASFRQTLACTPAESELGRQAREKLARLGGNDH